MIHINVTIHEAEDHSKALKRGLLVYGIFIEKLGNPENIAFY